ncbi:MAG: hypothetical protein ACYTEZ_04690 [Planctomycetota bacterium]|jgi:Spy/CpxP family protein refolding chaperone
MQVLRYVFLFLASFVLGWFAHSLTVDERSGRADRRGTAPTRRDPAAARAPRAVPDERAPVARPPVTHPTAPPAAEPVPETVATPVESGGAKKKDPIHEWIRSQSAMWKGWATMQSRQKLQSLLAALGFDEATTQAIEAAILAEVERQTELAIQMMTGDAALDADAFAYFMGLPPDLSPELERELAIFLGDDDIASVRTEVQKAYRKQLDDFADMQIGMMRIQDLSDDQRTRMRDIFSTDIMKDQFAQFAEVTRDSAKLTRLVKDPEGLGEFMKANMEPTRRRVRDVLNDEQFTKYEAFEQTTIKQIEVGIKMMSAMIEPSTPKPAKTGTRKPDGQ